VGGPVDLQNTEWLCNIDSSRRLADGRTVAEALAAWADDTDDEDDHGGPLAD
jgi:hypothetical protein